MRTTVDLPDDLLKEAKAAFAFLADATLTTFDRALSHRHPAARVELLIT